MLCAWLAQATALVNSIGNKMGVWAVFAGKKAGGRVLYLYKRRAI